MNRLKAIAVIFLALTFVGSAFAGDKEDALAAVNKVAEAFNRHDFVTYLSSFSDDNTEFPYVVSPLRYDAAMWKEFIEGTASLEYVNYHQQDVQVQAYNGSTAVLTAYYTFKWKPKGADLNTQSGRASIVLVKEEGKWLIVHMHFSKMF
jgi:ketosteroid isomerase-like protein